MKLPRLAALAVVGTVVGTLALLSPMGLGAQSSSLAGVVVVSPGNKPLASAEILMPGLKLSTRSDSTGRFHFGPFAAGTHEVLVRSIGYSPTAAKIVFRDSLEIRADFLMNASTVLETVDVRGVLDKRWASRLVEFEQRRAGGIGVFLAYDKLEKNSAMSVPALLTSFMPGVRIARINNTEVAISSRGGRNCPLQILMNRLNMYNGEGMFFDVNSIESRDILGVEYYNAFSTPSELNLRPRGPYGGSRCGTLVLWVK